MEKTSALRVAFVVCGTLIPMVILVISQELIPLNDPRKGWRVNYGFWARVGILSGVVSMAIVNQAKVIIRSTVFRLRQSVLLFGCQALTYPVASMGIAACVGFPIPFFALSTIPVFFLLLLVWFSLIAGTQCIRDILHHPKELTTFALYICTQMLMPVVYPIYEVIFYAAANTRYEFPVILLLSIIKIVMKYIISLALTGMEDMMPKAVTFSVDFFHAVYLATCVQRTRSTTTIVIVIAVDVAQSALMLYGLHKRSRTMSARARTAAGVCDNNGSLVTALRIICTSSKRLENQHLGGIRMRSCLPYRLSRTSMECINNLERVQQRRISRMALKRRALISRAIARIYWWHRRTSIRPIETAVISPIEDQSIEMKYPRQNSAVNRRSNVLKEGLETLFTSECLVLVGYLHTSIAMFYANFVVMMIYLPSARYHSELLGLTPENVGETVKSVFIFGYLEFLSFALLALMLYRRYGLQAFYHLAFVLETQVVRIQGKVIMWMLLILAFRVDHFGKLFILSNGMSPTI
ncbi:hypothetical protein L916_01850 [Phytophthora nicotianae]|nr:hypothetical protein L916_01850 [Phytophthora nicotianae]